MGKFKKEAFKWVSDFLMAMGLGFLFLAISTATAAAGSASLLVLTIASGVVFAILTATSFVFRMLAV